MERFQLGLMLCVIALRNMIEMAGSDIAFLPKSFIQGKSLVDSILSVRRLKTRLILTAADLQLTTACTVCHPLGDFGGLAQTRLHHQVQPCPRIGLWAIYGCPREGRPIGRIAQSRSEP